jgi:3-dehydroquinate synthase
MDHIQEVVLGCCDIKRQVVEQDETEAGLRMILNFGHTLGHVYEKAYNYETYTHGEAVAAGMVIAAQLGEKLGITPAGTDRKIAQVLEKFRLPTHIDASKADYQTTLTHDKKSDGGDISFIALEKIGKVQPVKLPKQQLLALL